MLGRSIFEETKRDIQDHADVYTTELRNELATQKSIFRAVQRANAVSNKYHTALVQTVFKRLRDIGNNAVDFYAPDLDPLEKEREVSNAIDELVHNRYYGLTLPQRLKQSHLQLRHNIKRSSAVGAKLDTKLTNITRVFNDVHPFGAQKHWDTRLFLAEAVRLEHTIAINIGARKGRKLVRWTLSSSHSKTDVCDRLATTVVPEVRDYIVEHSLNIEPAGVYFIESTPAIPHPNCQCVLKFARRSRKRQAPKPPPPHLNLVQRIIQAIFGKRKRV